MTAGQGPGQAVKRPRLVVFLGMDGAGKSTISSALCRDLRAAGSRADRVWFLGNEESPVRRFLRRAGGSLARSPAGSPAPGPAEGGLVRRPGWIRWLYPRVILADYAVFCFLKVTVPLFSGRTGILILDRSWMDVAMSLARETGQPPRDAIRRWAPWFPAPDLVIFLDIPGDLAYRRKAEDLGSPARAEALAAEYRTVAGFLAGGGCTRLYRVDAAQPAGSILAGILPLVAGEYGGAPA